MTPDGPQVKELTLNARDGTRIALRTLGDPDATRALVVVHGYGEHGGRYLERLAPLAADGWYIVIPDMRGHGRSAGARGHILRFDDYVDDLQRVLEDIPQPADRRAIFGHSNGGLIVLTHVLAHPETVSSAVVSSPLLRLGVKAPQWKLAAGRFLSRVLPKVSLPSEIAPEVLSHDPKVVADYKIDPLNHHVANARWFTEATRAGEAALASASDLALPLLLLQSGDDRLVAPDAAREFADAAPNDLIEYDDIPAAFHELIFEPDGATHVQRIATWLDNRVPA